MIYLNGAVVEAPAGATLEELLKLQGLDPARTAVAVDGKFVPRSEYRVFTPVADASVNVWELLEGG